MTFPFFGMSQVSDYGRKMTDTLASDHFKGRGYVEEGHKLAADFIAAEFNHLGLDGFDLFNESANPFFQEFELSVSVVKEPLLLKINGKTLKPGLDYLIDPSSRSQRGCKKVNRVDYYNEMRTEYASERGKKQPLIVRSHNKDARLNYSFIRSLKSEEIMESPLITLHEKLTWNIAPAPNSKPEIKLRSGAVDEPIRRVKYKIRTEQKSLKSQNVIGLMKGAVKPDSFIVVCGHYDHLGMMGEAAIFNGANDNASGVAIILDMVKTWKEENYNSPYSILFIAFGGEEVGLTGSQFFVENCPVDLQKIKFVLNIDLMGTGGAGITVVNSPAFPAYYNTMSSINDEKYMLLKLAQRKNTQNSDHWPFSKKGIPAFFIYAMGNWANYHDVLDRPENLPLTRFNDMRDLFKNFIEEVPFIR